MIGKSRCADCGVPITKRPWQPWRDARGRMICRSEIAEGLLISADYHHVEGESQRHWPNKKGTT